MVEDFIEREAEPFHLSFKLGEDGNVLDRFVFLRPEIAHFTHGILPPDFCLPVPLFFSPPLTEVFFSTLYLDDT